MFDRHGKMLRYSTEEEMVSILRGDEIDLDNVSVTSFTPGFGEPYDARAAAGTGRERARASRHVCCSVHEEGASWYVPDAREPL